MDKSRKPSNYREEYSIETDARVRQIREVSNELEQGKAMTANGKKLTTGLGGKAPFIKSQYKITYHDFKMPEKLVFGTPKMPVY